MCCTFYHHSKPRVYVSNNIRLIVQKKVRLEPNVIGQTKLKTSSWSSPIVVCNDNYGRRMNPSPDLVLLLPGNKTSLNFWIKTRFWFSCVDFSRLDVPWSGPNINVTRGFIRLTWGMSSGSVSHDVVTPSWFIIPGRGVVLTSLPHDIHDIRFSSLHSWSCSRSRSFSWLRQIKPNGNNPSVPPRSFACSWRGTFCSTLWAFFSCRIIIRLPRPQVMVICPEPSNLW